MGCCGCGRAPTCNVTPLLWNSLNSPIGDILEISIAGKNGIVVRGSTFLH